jgi:transcriptional regulator with XRE-family HTH domain
MRRRARKKDSIHIFLEQVGQNIRNHRQKKGLTLEALGEDIGLDKSNMHRIEQGKNITLVTLLKIAAFLEISPTKLIQNTPDVLMEDAEKYQRRNQ